MTNPTTAFRKAQAILQAQREATELLYRIPSGRDERECAAIEAEYNDARDRYRALLAQ